MERRRTLAASGIIIKHDDEPQPMHQIEKDASFSLKNEFKTFERQLTKLAADYTSSKSTLPKKKF